jgi:pimeloyl-ACP methyl ester carboxylesterase
VPLVRPLWCLTTDFEEGDQTMTTKFLDRPGGRISYDDPGGDGPLVVAAPGMGDSRKVYRHVAPALAAAGIRFVNMDLRGIGESTVDWDDYSDAAVASDYLALITELAAGPAVLVGNSLSCASAVIAASDSPEIVAGLVLIGPFARDIPQKVWQKAAFHTMLTPPWGRGAWISYYRKQLYPGPKPPDHDEYVDALSKNLSEPGRYASFRSLAFNSHAESGKRLVDVTQPALVIMGTADPDFDDPEAEATALGDILDADVVLSEGSGHYPQADSPDTVAPPVIELVHRASS